MAECSAMVSRRCRSGEGGCCCCCCRSGAMRVRFCGAVLAVSWSGEGLVEGRDEEGRRGQAEAARGRRFA